jgi:hypothetical protein
MQGCPTVVLCHVTAYQCGLIIFVPRFDDQAAIPNIMQQKLVVNIDCF